MLPRVILYNAVSLDGRFDWLSPDLGRFYELASHWKEDATLVGSNTVIAAEAEEPEESEEAPPPSVEDTEEKRPLLVIVDSRGRVKNWRLWRNQPYWRDAIALCSTSTPQAYIDDLLKMNIDYIVAGDDHVDFRVALKELNTRYGVKVVRIDSGGALNGVLLRAGLVDEVSLLIHPSLIGGITANSFYQAPDLKSAEGVVKLRLDHMERLDKDLVWLRYEVVG